jgi:photosystem II stability/assembly factor-like uncharacterized protein
MKISFHRNGLITLLIGCVISCLSQQTLSQQADIDTSLYNALRYRNIGPFRGGRSAAVTGIPGKPMTFFFGGTGGGVWKTENGGQSWKTISDGFFGGSIGAVAVSIWDNNVIYVGGGEKTVRGNVSHGYGMWKSEDAGKTWKNLGLKDSRHIPRIRIHPKNPNIVYAALLGHLFGPNEERGIYRSTDGGSTWKRTLFVSNVVGAVDLEMDPSNPRILYAAMWRVRRTPYSLESGGEGSGLWKSTDGGDSWTDISRNAGLPTGTLGIIGVTASAARDGRLWAIIEAEQGGVFRSDDGGAQWRKVNDERKLRQRAWYYSRIYADPRNEDIVYVTNVQFWRSKDAGRTYESIGTPHGDHHDLWIAPEDPSRMIIADDGGAQVTFNGGESWSTYMNQPTAQFYRVTTDNHFPYRIYGGQQDNSTVRIAHRSGGWVITERDWESTAGGESGWLAPHPLDPTIVYGGSYAGFLERFNHTTKESRLVDVWPDNPMGHGARDLKYRFQWNFPIFFSPHDPGILYAAGNVLFKTTNEGESWIPMSGDLTRNDKTKMEPSGGPITKDNTSVEYYGTIFAAAESPHKAGVLWAGSDDGLLHLTQDGGITWKNVTPPARLMPEWIQINSIEVHPFEPGGLYLAATMYKSDDFRPYLYRTTDFGQTWRKITAGIDPSHFTRVIRADPKRPGLLYAGTESAIYISFNDGERWQPFQLNLPIVPITDLAIKENDLVVATQGRSFWVLDDLTPLHQVNDKVRQSSFWLYTPRPTYMLDGGHAERPSTAGENPPAGVMIHYYLKTEPDSAAIALRILDSAGTVIRTFQPKAKESNARLPMKKGMNRFIWNLRYPDAETFPDMILWFGGTAGPRALPGTYGARLVVGKDSMGVPFHTLKDPRSTSLYEDLRSQFHLLLDIRDKLSETHSSIKKIRDIRTQIESLTGRLKSHAGADTIKSSGKLLLEKLRTIEEALYQTKNKSGQDPLNYPVRLNNKLSTVAAQTAAGDFRPTDQAMAVYKETAELIEAELNLFRLLLSTELPAFNTLVRDLEVPAIIVDVDKGRGHSEEK